LQLKKIRRLIKENQIDLEKSHTAEEMDTLLQTHQILKQQEMELSKKTGTVIVH
jgi:hypothetical protein